MNGNRPWVILSLQLLESNLEEGFWRDLAKSFHSSLRKEFYVLTSTCGKFLLEGEKVYTLTPIPKGSIEGGFRWLKQRISHYADRKILLVIASHGSGKAIKIRDGLEVPLERLRDAIPFPIEILCLDSCMMATTSVVSSLSGVARYLIAMEDYCGWEGFFSPYLDDLFCDDVKRTGILIINEMARRAFAEKDGATSISLIDLTKSFPLNEKEISSPDCRVDPEDDLLHDYTCTLGRNPSSVVHTRSKVENRSGLAILNSSK